MVNRRKPFFTGYKPNFFVNGKKDGQKIDNLEKILVSLENSPFVPRKEYDELFQKLEVANLAYEGLAEDCVSRGEYDSLLHKHTEKSKALQLEIKRCSDSCVPREEYDLLVEANIELFKELELEKIRADAYSTIAVQYESLLRRGGMGGSA